MKIHEYQAKANPPPTWRECFPSRSSLAHAAEEASHALYDLGGSLAVVKAQNPCRCRGKGTIKSNPNQRGVQLVRSASDAATIAGNILARNWSPFKLVPKAKLFVKF